MTATPSNLTTAARILTARQKALRAEAKAMRALADRFDTAADQITAVITALRAANKGAYPTDAADLAVRGFAQTVAAMVVCDAEVGK